MNNETTPSISGSPEPDSDAQTSFDWLIAALGGRVDGPADLMLARPTTQELQLLLPLASRRATVASLRRGNDNRGPRARMLSTAARTIGRTGLLPRLTGEPVEFPETAVLRQIREFLGDSTIVSAVTIGPPRRNRKPVLSLFGPSGATVAFAKVGWSPFTNELTRNEFDMLKLVDGRLSAPLRTPAPLTFIDNGEQTIALMSAAPNTDWARPRALVPEQIDDIAYAVGHRRTTVSDLDWLRNPHFGERSDKDEDRLEAAVSRVAQHFASEEVEVGLWHGDFNPWNLLSEGGMVSVIDWEFAGLDRPVGQDRRHLRFEATRRGGDTAPAASLQSFIEQELQGRSTPTELAIYLADITIRESRLSGQGWAGPMSGYRVPLTDALEGLLR